MADAVSRPWSSSARVLHLGVGLVVVSAAAYVVARAVSVPITYDEATSLYRYVQAEPAALADFAAATNHLLNSVLTRAVHAVAGSAPWALRLPNVLAGVMFLVVAARLAGRTHQPVIGAAGAVLLATNPYLLDYFALSRGYGLAAGLQTASWFVWLHWWAPLRGTPGARDLAIALGLAALAVTASYSVLPALVALLTLSLGRLAWRARAGTPASSGNTRPVWSWTAAAAWVLLATGFTALVFARERVPDPGAYVPISVRIAGLFPHETDGVRVFRYDTTGRLRALPRRQDGTWRTGPVEDAWHLRVLMPVAADHNLALLEVTAGDASFGRTRRQPGPWHVQDVSEIRVLTSTDALRWRGDAAHRRFVATRTAGTMAALAALLAPLMLLARMAVRRHLANATEARAVVWTIVGTATVTAAPIYLLRRDEQLFFGGSTGLVTDTVASLVRATAYGAPVSPDVVDVAVWLGLAMLLLPLALAVAAARSRQLPTLGIAGAFVAMLAICLALARLQHAMMKVPYPIGRTALYLLPLAVIGTMFTADAVAARGRWWRRGATAVMAALAIASVWNVVCVANQTHALDWPGDSEVPAMLQEVLGQAGDTSRASRPIRLGVDWPFYPAARYYVDRLPPGSPRVEPLVLPGDGLRLDFGYGPLETLPKGGRTIARHSVSGAELHQLRR
jgi:hypothetical protein